MDFKFVFEKVIPLKVCGMWKKVEEQ